MGKPYDMPTDEIDREDLYEETRKEESRLREIANKHGKLRLDIESDAPVASTQPILITSEDDGIVIDVAEVVPK